MELYHAAHLRTGKVLEAAKTCQLEYYHLEEVLALISDQPEVTARDLWRVVMKYKNDLLAADVADACFGLRRLLMKGAIPIHKQCKKQERAFKKQTAGKEKIRNDTESNMKIQEFDSSAIFTEFDFVLMRFQIWLKSEEI